MPPRAKSKKTGLLTSVSDFEARGSAVSLLAEIRALIDEKDVAKVMATLRGALDAEQHVRASRDSHNEPMKYEKIPDWNARLTSARVLLAYRFGQAPSHAEVHVHDHSGSRGADSSPDDLMRELIESGSDLQKIIGTYVNGLKTASPAAPSAAASSKAAEIGQNQENPPQHAGPVEILEV